MESDDDDLEDVNEMQDASYKRPSLFTDLRLVNDDENIPPNMSHMSTPDESTETIDDDVNQHPMFKRDTRNSDNRQQEQQPKRAIVVKYQWFRNDQLLNDFTGKEFHIFTNGTLRISYTSRANGNFRCMASASGLGRVMSKRCSVQQASKFNFNSLLTDFILGWV